MKEFNAFTSQEENNTSSPSHFVAGLRLHIKRTLEALLFSTHEPLSFNKIREIVENIYPMQPRQLKELIDEMRQEYEEEKRAFQIDEIAEGYLLRTKKEYSPYIERLSINKRLERLSQAAMEVLAIIAYRQPVTRSSIDSIRGVDSSGTLHNLIERELIEVVGKLEAPGRPSLYSITPRFLQHFGLRSLDELPQFEPEGK